MKPIVVIKEYVNEGRMFSYLGNSVQIRRSRLVMMNFLHTKKLPRWLCVHHIDGNKLNDSIENLQIITQSIHASMHGNPNQVPLEQRRRASYQKNNNSQRTKDRVKRWRDDHAVELKEKQHVYYLNNKEKIKKRVKEWKLKRGKEMI